MTDFEPDTENHNARGSSARRATFAALAACAAFAFLDSSAAAAGISTAPAPAQEGKIAAPSVVRPEIRVSFEIDGQTVDIRVDDREGEGAAELQLDGQEMPEDRFERRDGLVVLKDRYGAQVGHVGVFPQGLNLRFHPLGQRAHLGVDLQPIGDALAAHLDLDADEVAHVVNVIPDSPADRAGVERHDIIVSIDGEGPVSRERLRKTLGERRPGDRMTLRVLRRGREEQIEVVLGRSPAGVFPGPFGTLWSGDATVNFAQGLLNQWNQKRTPSAQAWQHGLGWLQSNDNKRALLLPENFAKRGKGDFTSFWNVPSVGGHGEGEGDADRESERLEKQVDRLEERLAELEKLIRSLKRDNE